MSVSGDAVHLTWAPSTLASSAPVTGYQVKRYDATGAAEQAITSGSCAATVETTSCSETSVPDGTWKYSVTPVKSNWRGAESPPSTAQVAASPSTAVITFPANGGSYHDSGFTGGCGTASTGDVCGTVEDAGSGITGVKVSLQQGTGSYWNGTGFTSSSEVLLDATGTTSWSHPFSATSFPADGQYTLRARVTDGAGNTTNTASTFTIDRTAPVAPTIDSAPSSSSSSTAPSFGFSNTEAGVQFQCRLNGSAWAGCVSPKSYSGLANGSHTFDVRSVDAAGNIGNFRSYTWVVDTVAPSAAITFPASGGATYASGGTTNHFNAGCGTDTSGDVCGTASDTGGTGVNQVQISMQQGTGSYWNGTGFTSSSEVLLIATGTTSWSHLFSATSFPADGQYTLRARVTDKAGNTTMTSTTFTVDVTAPRAVDVQAANGTGTPGQIDINGSGDSITFTYSERIRPGSILSGWDGTTAASVTVRVNEGPGQTNDTLTVWNGGNATQLPLGVVDLGGVDYTIKDYTYSSTMTQSGNDIKIDLGSRVGASNNPSRTTTTMTWTPNPNATDLFGNPTNTTAVTESGAADSEF